MMRKACALVHLPGAQVRNKVAGDAVLSLAELVTLLALPFWGLKQATNVLQLQFSAQRLAAADGKRK